MKPLLRKPLLPILVVAQVALAFAIGCNCLYFMQQKLAWILAPDGVRDPSQLVVLTNIATRGAAPAPASIRAIETGLEALPGAVHASYAVAMPLVGATRMLADVVGQGARGTASAAMYFGDNLPAVLGLRLREGRWFSDDERSVSLGPDMGLQRSGPVIVTRALADRLYPDGDALGKVVRLAGSGQGMHVIVGVVAHLARNEPAPGSGALDYSVLFPGIAESWPAPLFALRLRRAATAMDCAAARAVIRRGLGAAAPSSDAQCDSFANYRDAMLAQPRAAMWLLSAVALMVLIVTLVGIVGITGHWVQQRTRGIGIRRALGARRVDILRELMAENALIAGAGVGLGLIFARGVNLWLVAHYEMPALPWWQPLVAACLMLLLCQVATFAPAMRGASVPPVSAMRVA